MRTIMRLIFLMRSYPASSSQHVYTASQSTCTPPLSDVPLHRARSDLLALTLHGDSSSAAWSLGQWVREL